jgi:hypothetical protein
VSVRGDEPTPAAAKAANEVATNEVAPNEVTAHPVAPGAQPVTVAQATPTMAPAPAAVAAPIMLTKPASRFKGNLITYASFAFNAYTYLGASGKSPQTNLNPGNRAIIYQQLGFGWFFHRLFRVMLTLQFGETLTNVPAGASTFTVFGIIPWVVFSTHGFWTGAGPVLAPISYGKAPNFDAGIYTATGYAVKLGKGFTLPMGVQLVFMLSQRTSIAVTPTVALAYRF